MCIHHLAMADGLSAVPDYLPGRHRGERPRSWSSSPLLIVIPALDRHPRESGDLASLIPTASRHRVPALAGMTAIIRNCCGTAAESERKHARSCTFTEIEREACRERGSQSVKITGGGVSVKKQHNKTKQTVN